MAKTLVRVAIILSALSLSACGYLDQDLLIDDAEFEETLGVGGLALSGIGTSGGGWGCGYGSYGHRYRGLQIRRGVRALQLADGTIQVDMSDQQILDQTDVDMIDESDAAATAPNTAEELYYSQLQARDQALADTY